MQEIANGTFNYATLSEIMPMIYKRFTEKAAEEWRQIYKALQLLEFLIKNGSERVIDDARSHLSLLKMLRQFHFIDQNGKDQGLNVRNRAKELADLLGDVEKIRSERKKARTTRNKYGGVEGGASNPTSMSGSGRYGGFAGGAASTDYGSYSGGVYGDGGGFGGAQPESDYTSGQSRNDRFDEYDEYDDASGSAPPRRKHEASSLSTTRTSKPEPPKPKAPEVDLFDFGDDDIVAPVAPASNGKQKAVTQPAALADFGADDEFDDFQSATVTSSKPPTQFAAPQPQQAQNGSAMNNLFSTISPPPSTTGTSTPVSNYAAFNVPTAAPPPQSLASPTPQAAPTQSFIARPQGYQAPAPNYYGSVPVASATTATSATGVQSSQAQRGPLSPGLASKPAAKTSSSSDPFASLALGGSTKQTTAAKGPTMADMAKQKATAGIWGASTGGSQAGSSQGDLI